MQRGIVISLKHGNLIHKVWSLPAKNCVSVKWYMDLARFDENTRHMIIFHVLTHDSPVGDKGDRMRLFFSDKGYRQVLESEKDGNIQILSHAKVIRGNLLYDRKDQIR